MNPIQPFPCKGKGLLSIVTKLINVIIDIGNDKKKDLGFKVNKSFSAKRRTTG